MPGLGRLKEFVVATTRLVEERVPAAELLARIGPILQQLVSHDDWLPAECAVAHPQTYRQYLLHCDPLERFSVVSFVWGPGQRTPVHDHTVWGAVGILRGAEISTSFSVDDEGRLIRGVEERLDAGQVALLGPAIGDVHQVSNALTRESSVSIHIYGGNIGKVQRHIFSFDGANPRTFISGYDNANIPNIWR